MTVTHNSYHQKAQNCNKTLFVTKRAFVEIKILPEQPEFCTTNCSHIPKVFHLCKTFDVALIVINAVEQIYIWSNMQLLSIFAFEYDKIDFTP